MAMPNANDPLVAFPPIVGDSEETREGQREPGQQVGPVDFSLGDHDLERIGRCSAEDRHHPAETVDDPVLDDADLEVLSPLLLVVATAIPARARDELDGDRGDVGLGIGTPPQAGPDDAVGASPTRHRLRVTLGEGPVEGRTRRVTLSIVAKQVGQILRSGRLRPPRRSGSRRELRGSARSDTDRPNC